MDSRNLFETRVYGEEAEAMKEEAIRQARAFFGDGYRYTVMLFSARENQPERAPVAYELLTEYQQAQFRESLAELARGQYVAKVTVKATPLR